ncbi:MAG TPA: chemotaxis protein CheW, partial [bacterium]|nr:chemotaxis protein CheW [bacterium]
MADKQKNLKFLHFRSGNSDYAVELEYVKEIIRSVAVSPMNELPPFAPGVINLRGEIIPIIDFLLRSGAGATTLRLKSRIIITRIHDITAGLLVD